MLAKPVRRHELLDVVRRRVSAKEHRRPQALLADDDPNSMRIVSSFSADEPIDVRCASGGREALEMMAARQPNLAILDLMMPMSAVLTYWPACAVIRRQAPCLG